MVSIVLIGCFAGILLSAFLYLTLKARSARAASWADLVARLEPLHRKGLELVALDNLQPGQNQLRFDPAEMWDLVGGVEGLRRMSRNANVLIALAAHVHQWNYEEAIIVAERMRRDAAQLRSAIFRIRLEILTKRVIGLPFNLHHAATSYYLMTQRLLSLYQSSHAGLYPALAEVL